MKVLLVVLGLSSIALVGAAQNPSRSAASARDGNAQNTVQHAENDAFIARGKYIVDDVAMCGSCHTPLGQDGQRDRSQWLKGAAVQTRPTYSDPNWALRAPRIAGDPPGTDDDFIRLMTTGIARTGKPPNPPMLQFQMTTADAQAVLAYLKSLR